MAKKTRYTVVGAGHGGRAMAAHLALMGFPVNLYNRTAQHVAAIKTRGGIELKSYEGGPHGFAELAMVTSDMEEALREAQVIMVVVPSSAHADIARKAAPYLHDGQIVLLNPGRTGGAMEFTKVLSDQGCEADATVAEAETFIYASRSEGPAESRIFRMKDAVPLAALPAHRTDVVLEALKSAYPQFINGVNVLHTGLNNMGAVFHPALTLLNAARIESTKGEFQFYIDGVTPSVGLVLEVLDRERVTVAAALGIRARTALEWLRMAYDATGANLAEAILNQPGYRGIMAPRTLRHRYLFEDVPMSLVPIVAFAQRYGVSVRGMESVVRLACFVHRTDYWRRGRSLGKLGIERWSVSELTAYVNEGVVPSGTTWSPIWMAS
ncbi:MAG: NAD(P)-binding domain-containing protein [Anaerolineae bacterium]|nr:NAD(P)-binding domain-containing protein [Anaerolineae bacterium]NIN99688.1 NAD(P)-binding domain-containing protein [Anaerolineae bacterium]NIQ82541.1 NAD(P)-binding domain-containing protein [Anaerolineae bacterium]